VRKYVFSFLLLMIAGTAMCQKKSKVNLVSSTKSEGVKRNGIDVLKVYDGNWAQDFSKMRSDSAYFYQLQNAFDAFGHVVINQGDTLHIYADKLHYDGNTKIAVLTDNVIMVDKDATLTTNNFTYNTATKIGIYTNGGKIVNKGNTLTSTNGYYFAGSHDAYFRYNVVCVTTDALINTDTMRYNSKTRINYFYGPTHIYGTKDKDTLDTDFGTYDTNTEQAFFTKNNLYRQGTKSLKGDTLFYDRVKGYGRAVKHVVFNDNEQKVTIRGGLGTYFKANDLTIMTRDPYVILVTEDKKDTTKHDTAAVNLAAASKKDLLTKKPGAKNTKAAAANAQTQAGQAIKSLSPGQRKLIDSAVAKMPSANNLNSMPALPVPANIDTLKKMARAQSKTLDKGTIKKLKAASKNLQVLKPDTNDIITNTQVKDTSKVKRDSVFMSADTIETRILTFKELKTMQELERLSHIKDTTLKTKKAPIVYKKAPKFLTLNTPKLPKDTSYFHRNYFGPPKPKLVKVKKTAVKDTTAIATVSKKKVKIDSTFLDRDVILHDTSRVRIIMAFHSGKIFKSDLQAKADSIFYSNSDSTIRCYIHPMMWTEGSQISGDTIFLQMKNKKLDNMFVYPPAFIVNVEKGDSVHFNQVGGKKMRGFFKDSKLSRIYVEGNAETIYFERDSATNEVTDMQRSFSSRIRVYMANNEVTDLAFLTKADNRYIPINKVKDDDKILKNFIWKPKDRPISKESIIPSYNKAHDTTKTIAGMPRAKRTYGAKGADSTLNKKPGAVQDSTLKQPPGQKLKDSTLTIPPKNLPGQKPKADSVLTAPVNKPAPLNPNKGTPKSTPPLSPMLPAKKDTTKSN
jgi:lipopolysaccharide export system protein LptA